MPDKPPAEGDRRLVSKTQRRALMVRDLMCRFPGCHRARHLQAHHVIPWGEGGPTDLDNLILLCQRHHTYVHEGRLSLHRVPHGWHFRLPDGRDVDELLTSWGATDESLARYLTDHARDDEQRAASVSRIAADDAQRLSPGGSGGFSLDNCVEALFGLAEIQHRRQQRAA